MSEINFTKTTLENLTPPHKGFKVYKNIKDERIILGKFPDLTIENARKKVA